MEIGRVLSLEGEIQEAATSPIDGHVWAIRRFASVQSGNIAYLIAHPT